VLSFEYDWSGKKSYFTSEVRSVYRRCMFRVYSLYCIVCSDAYVYNLNVLFPKVVKWGLEHS